MAGLVRSALSFVYPIADANVCVMTLHTAQTGVDTPTDADVIAINTVLTTWWETGVEGEVSGRSLCNPECLLVAIRSQKIRPAPAALPHEVIGVFSVGSRAGAGLPPQMACCVSLRTNIASRRTRGRMYLPGLREADVTSSGLFDPGFTNDVSDSFDGLRRSLDNVNLGTFEQVVFSRVSDSWQRVVSVRVGDRADVQRRRKITAESYVTGS